MLHFSSTLPALFKEKKFYFQHLFERLVYVAFLQFRRVKKAVMKYYFRRKNYFFIVFIVD